MDGVNQKFHFVAVNPDGKKLSGVVLGESEEDARQKLSQKGLALFSIDAFSAEDLAVTEGFERFSFEGLDGANKPIRGTIEAVDAYEAYVKLRKDYEFNVLYVVNISLPAEEQQAYKTKGIPPQWVERFKLENKEEVDTEEAVKKSKKQKATLLSQQDRAELQYYQEEIGRVTAEVLELLKNNEEFLNAPARRKILDRVNLLSRLRRSNAIEHLRELTKKLLRQLGDDKIFIEATGLSHEKQEELSVRKVQFSQFSERLEKTLTAGIAAISVGFAALDKEKVKMKLIEADPLRHILRVLYVGCVSLLGLFFVFWGVKTAKLLLNISVGSIWYSYRSPLLWILTGVALISTFGLFPLLYFWPKLSPLKKFIFFVSMIGAIFIFLWFSPFLFWWTR